MGLRNLIYINFVSNPTALVPYGYSKGDGARFQLTIKNPPAHIISVLMARHRVSVVIPNMNEERLFGIIGDVRRLLGAGAEIIVVDKSSAEFYRRLRKTGVKIVRQRDRGVAQAIMQGMRVAKGDILASIDGDGTHDPDGLPRAVKVVESGKADLVLGNRLAALQEGSMGPYILFGNSALSAIFNALYGTGLHDITTGLFVMRREVFEKMKDMEPYSTGTAFFIAEAAKAGYRIGEVDIRYYERQEGQSKLAKSKFFWGLRAAWLFLANRF
jgi:glycosyltransferase involved in cell wall biosynthesis